MNKDDDETGSAKNLSDGDVLYERESGTEYLRIIDVSKTGVTFRHGETEYHVSHAAFAPWNEPDLVVARDHPVWCRSVNGVEATPEHS
jgi:hypothetical protein